MFDEIKYYLLLIVVILFIAGFAYLQWKEKNRLTDVFEDKCPGFDKEEEEQ